MHRRSPWPIDHAAWWIKIEESREGSKTMPMIEGRQECLLYGFSSWYRLGLFLFRILREVNDIWLPVKFDCHTQDKAKKFAWEDELSTIVPEKFTWSCWLKDIDICKYQICTIITKRAVDHDISRADLVQHMSWYVRHQICKGLLCWVEMWECSSE